LANYQPTSRRPIADIFRRTAHLAVEWCVRHNIHPDIVSYSSIVAAALAAICFWQARHVPFLLLIGPLFCYLRLWFNMLDGMVALASGKASLRGEIVNELPDRVSDVLIFVGVAHSGFCCPCSGYWTAIAALFVAYVGTLGQAVAGKREFSGPMSKQWRMVTLHIGSWIALGAYWKGIEPYVVDSLTILDLTCLLIIVGCIATVIIRLRRIVRTLDGKAASSSITPSGGD
jgi:phosphatidylglycerophosphate synthase